ncbi:MAG: DUF116 domain-containing protein [Thermoclostridium sp.]|nr:DUF116 domain-containing protein [Thermoclostridium sp.]
MEQNKPFQKLSVLVIAGFMLLIVIISVAAGFFSMTAFRLLFYIVGFFLLLFFFAMIAGFLGMMPIISTQPAKGLKEKSLSTRLAIKVFMPVLLAISNVFHYRKDEIRHVYIKANNDFVLSASIKVKPENILVILPHCIQSSKCMFRIRNGLEDCHQCGSCNVGEIKRLANQLGVQIELATGGTSARKIILESKPQMVIAVACERDLSSGIMDVKGLPVYGILNKRPNGPCKDTFVDIEELERMLHRFTEGY